MKYDGKAFGFKRNQLMRDLNTHGVNAAQLKVLVEQNLQDPSVVLIGHTVNLFPAERQKVVQDVVAAYEAEHENELHAYMISQSPRDWCGNALDGEVLAPIRKAEADRSVAAASDAAKSARVGNLIQDGPEDAPLSLAAWGPTDQGT